MTVKIDALKRRLHEQLTKNITLEFVSNPSGAIRMVLWLIEDPQYYDIEMLRTDGKSLNKNALCLDIKTRLHEYIRKYSMNSYSVSDAITDTLDLLSKIGVTVIDTRNGNY